MLMIESQAVDVANAMFTTFKKPGFSKKPGFWQIQYQVSETQTPHDFVEFPSVENLDRSAESFRCYNSQVSTREKRTTKETEVGPQGRWAIGAGILNMSLS